MTNQVKKLSIEDFKKSITNYLGAVTKFENTSNIAGRDIRIAYSQGNLENFLNPIVAKLDGSKYPEKVNALRSLLMDNTDKKITLARLEGKGYEVSEPTQTRQRDIKAGSLAKQVGVVSGKVSKCSTLSPKERAEVEDHLRKAELILQARENAETAARKSANQNGK